MRELLLFFECWIELARAKIAIQITPRRVIRGSLIPTTKPSHRAAAKERDLIRSLARAERNHIFSISCLPRALALQRLLRRRGADAALRIGVRRNGAFLQAHAWVDRDGEVINDDAEVASIFLPLERVDESIASWVEKIEP